jgi:RNA polymerase sigma-70 factor, ECF subfamily
MNVLVGHVLVVLLPGKRSPPAQVARRRRLFPRGAPELAQNAAVSASEDPVVQRFREARRFWDGIALEEQAFRDHLCALAVEPEIETLCANDLYLVAAVLANDAKALALLDREFVVPARSSIEKVHAAADFVDDVLQELRGKLLVGPEARLRRYAGRSPLEGWIRVTATRLAYDVARARVFKDPGARDEELERMAADAVEPELAALKATLGRVFQEAIRAGVAALSARERTLLWMHLVDGLSIDQIARPYGVHRATAARWLNDVKGKVIDGVRARVREAHGSLTSAELDSLGRLVLSQLHLSLPGTSARQR